MKRLWVREPHRKLGMGRQLADAVIAAACRIGYDAMRLDTLGRLVEANGLYTSMGFREIPPYYHNPEPGAVYFERALTHDTKAEQEPTA